MERLCHQRQRSLREIIEQGYRGRQVTVAAYLAPFRTLASAPPVAAIVPKVRHVVSWMLPHPDDLDDEQQLHLKQARASCPELDATAAHVSAFAAMLTGRHSERLESWMAAVEADNLPHLHRFVTGLRRDHPAVLNGLTSDYSSGAVEGNVNRVKMIKRQMYGRATFDLLRNASCSPDDLPEPTRSRKVGQIQFSAAVDSGDPRVRCSV